MTPANVAATTSAAVDRHAPLIALGDREERHQRPEALVDDLPLDQVGVQDGRGERDRQDRDRPSAADDERQRLEQQERDAERIALARSGRRRSRP